jgi:hypothetical protein
LPIRLAFPLRAILRKLSAKNSALRRANLDDKKNLAKAGKKCHKVSVGGVLDLEPKKTVNFIKHRSKKCRDLTI